MNKDMKTSKLSVGTAAKFLIPALCLSTALTAAGATLNWDGGGSNGSGANWSLNTSWVNPTTSVDPASAPGASDTAAFLTTAGNNVATVDANVSVMGLDFKASPTVSTTFNADNVGTGGTRTITVLNGNGSFRHNLTLNGVILNKAAGSLFDLTTAGLTTLTLNNGGAWNLSASGVQGRIWTSSDRSIQSTAGTGSISVASGATLHFSGGESIISVKSPVSFTSAGTVNMFQGKLYLEGSSALSGTVNFNGTTVGSTSTLRNSGSLTASSLTVSRSGSNTALFENTAGTLTFAGALDLNVPFSVSGGTVQGVTTAATSSTAAGNVAVSGGTISPAGAGVGTLRLPDMLNFTGGTYAVSITGGGADQLIAGGAVSLGAGLATLSVTSTDVTDGTVFTVLSGSSLTGTFAGLANGSTINGGSQSYTVNYTGTGVNLTAVPEPQFVAGAVGLGLLGFTVWRRCQKRA